MCHFANSPITALIGEKPQCNIGESCGVDLEPGLPYTRGEALRPLRAGGHPRTLSRDAVAHTDHTGIRAGHKSTG
jgi:hypothetical protein